MTLPQTFGFAAALVGAIIFAAKLAVEGELTDVFALVGLCVTVGYMGNLL